MKRFLLPAVLMLWMLMSAAPMSAQTKLYDEERDAMAQILEAVAQAQEEGKYVFCQVGGNWCPWCIRFANFVEQDTAVNMMMHDNYVYIHVNWSKDNKNPEAMRYLGNPARFGFPVFVILNEKGEPIHIQNSAYLEQDKGYNEKAVLEFLQNWTRQSIETLR